MKSLLFLSTFLAFLAAGCATQTRVDLAPLAVPKGEAPREKVLIAPFTTYDGLDLKSWQELNLTFYEAFRANLLSASFFTVPFEDVLLELARQGKLRIREPQKIKLSPTLLELYQEEDWSPLMKEELGVIITAEIRRQRGRAFRRSPVLNLESSDILSLARRFGARYVLRGRILEFSLRQEDTLNPFKIGFLTAQNRALSRLLYGAPQSGGYGVAQEVSVGGILAAVAGSNAKDPFEPPHKKTIRVGHPLFGQTYTRHSGGTEDYDLANALAWGAAGAFVSYLAAHGGDTPEAVVSLSVDLYDLKSGEIVWENRVRLRVSPQSMWAPRQPEDLLLTAVEEAARLLAIQMGQDLGLGSSLAAKEEPPQEANPEKISSHQENNLKIL